jgi:4'-phosphopantetheinyl transferase
MGRNKSTELFWIFYQSADRLTGEEAGFLSPDEKRHLARLRFEKRRTDWLLGRWAVKSLLMRSRMLVHVTQMDFIQIANEGSGAPYVTDLEGVRLPGCISISHREGAAFCVYSPTPHVRLGADLELIERKEASFFADYFTSAEKSIALQCNEKERDLAILLAWSGKEAVFKALGTGMRMDTRSVETGGFEWIKDQAITENEWYDLTLSCQLADTAFHGRWMLRGSYVLTLATKSEPGLMLLHEV